MKSEEYIAIQLSSDAKISGFETEEAAWEYILSQDCDDCKRLRKEGSPFGGTCAAEWDVVTKKELESWTNF